MALFQIAISRAARTTVLLPSGSAAAPLPVALVGDAAVTAHYRLGIGVNNAFKVTAAGGVVSTPLWFL